MVRRVQLLQKPGPGQPEPASDLSRRHAQSVRELSLSLFPHGVEPLNVGGRRWQPDALQGIYAVVLAIVIVLALTVAVLSVQGLAFEPTIMAGIAALSNAGPVYGAGPDAQAP